ncbi:hypothetical protein GH714_012915 [Hevea brasiliensis]|uniref:Inhibitor I9 domain-containing protein n=1 Tax=Hevea brasiliensis TaxID=3981 RepID=A0A6A6NGT2_HEVBR|nr:hypothetical protein GH714_012915 [Hevea brasiliensis]
MASSGYSAPTPPVFSREGYAIWAVKMKAYLKAFDLWEVTETGRQTGPLREDPTLAQIKAHSKECAKGFKALSCIHASVSEVIFTRIMACETAKQAWDLLKAEIQGSEQTKQMSILNLRMEFETKTSDQVKKRGWKPGIIEFFMATYYNILSCGWLFFAAVSLFIPTLAQTDNYIVHMDLSAMPKAFSSQQSWYLATLSSASAVSTSKSTITPTVPTSSKLIYTYTHAMSGFSAHLSPYELEALKNSPGYISSFKDLPVKLDTTRSPTFLGLNSNSGAWKASNYGEDIIIGLVDTGIWPESASYSDSGISGIPNRWKGECESGTSSTLHYATRSSLELDFLTKV